MYNFLTKNGQTVAFLLGVVIVVIFLLNIFGGLSTFETMPEEEQATTGIFNFGLTGAIALVVIAAIAMVLFGLFQVFTNLRGSLKGIVGFLILLGIFFGAYTMASGDATPYIEGAINKFEESGNGEITENNLKFISGGISTVGALLAIAVAAFVIAEIRNFFK